jgi:hypothetical protein
MVRVEEAPRLRARVAEEVLHPHRREPHHYHALLQVHEVDVEAIVLVPPLLLRHELAGYVQQPVARQAAALLPPLGHHPPPAQWPVGQRLPPRLRLFADQGVALRHHRSNVRVHDCVLVVDELHGVDRLLQNFVARRA